LIYIRYEAPPYAIYSVSLRAFTEVEQKVESYFSV